MTIAVSIVFALMVVQSAFCSDRTDVATSPVGSFADPSSPFAKIDAAVAEEGGEENTEQDGADGSATDSSSDDLPRQALLDVSPIMQLPELPTGCEATALAEALSYELGRAIGKEEIADGFMPIDPAGEDFVHAFVGDPHSPTGSAIMAPGIADTVNAYLSSEGSGKTAHVLVVSSFEALFPYVAAGHPVVIWVTIGYVDPGAVIAQLDGYEMHDNSHAVVLIGYDLDAGMVTLADPLAGIEECPIETLSYVRHGMGEQAVAVGDDGGAARLWTSTPARARG